MKGFSLTLSNMFGFLPLLKGEVFVFDFFPICLLLIIRNKEDFSLPLSNMPVEKNKELVSYQNNHVFII